MPVRPIVFGGSHTLVRQSYDAREMGHGIHNADGYGVGWYHGGRPVRIREARPIWHDPDLEDVLSSVRSSCSLALVRSASPGIPLDRGEVAPFVFERWSFGLNGYVRKFHTHAMRALRSTLPDELYTQIRGTSDTETLFLLAIAEVRKGASPGTALARAAEVESVLRDAHYRDFLADMYGNVPNCWQDELSGTRRLRMIVNAFTRMRMVDAQGRLDFSYKGPPGGQPPYLAPWFARVGKLPAGCRVVFGHWSALGCFVTDRHLALDSGCVWGGSLSAVRLDGPPQSVSVPGL